MKFICAQSGDEAHEVYGSIFLIPPSKKCKFWSIGLCLREHKRSYRIIGSYKEELVVKAIFNRILDFLDSSEKNVFYMPEDEWNGK